MIIIKNKFIKSTIILIIGGIITKILSMVIRIVTTRLIGDDGIGLYMLIMPSFNFFIAIGTLSFSTAISKVISENDKENKTVMITTILFSLIFNTILIFIILICSPFIATNLLNNPNLTNPLKMTAFTIPFITISNIIRGYFFGKEKMLPHVFSNLVEQIVRILLLIFIIPNILQYAIEKVICFLVLFNIFSEFFGTIMMLLFIRKKIVLKKSDIRINFEYLKEVFCVSIPTTASRLISSFGMFLEPIVITYIFLKIGYDNAYIVKEYGILQGYVLPMVTMPSFLTGAISQAILPIVSKYYKARKIIFIKKKILLAFILSIFIGVIATSLMFFYPNTLLKLIFNTNYGVTYLKTASLIFLISYLISPISAVIQGMGESFKLMLISFIAIVFRIITLSIFSFYDFGMNCILYSYLVYFIIIIILSIKLLKKELR